ncbi:MAG TPA: hypothetical protein DCF68_22245 [Cyanothece sp. UBA12306]|nr:hypothetical protein [Cyanothece sp. UBA12306]
MRSHPIPSLCLSLLILIITWGLIGCSDRLEASQPLTETIPEPVITSKLAEVAPPAVIEELSLTLDQYQPQVKIISPKTEQVFSETTVAVQLEVQDYPLFKDSDLGLGPHLHLILDNNPYQAVYSVDEPVILEDLTPGTHTLRVFASRPWHESFKNDGAYAQTTFHILTKTGDNAPAPNLPLLTYSRPKGKYGEQPIMLDFYLTNAPLHLVAQESSDDQVTDWRIRATINGESFLIDTWQPIYLNGFEEGNNWVHLEFIDEQGNRVDNAFNNTVRVITYEPNGQDTLSKIVRGELSSQIARSIVDANYTPPISSPSTDEENLTLETKSETEETTTQAPPTELPLSSETVPTVETEPVSQEKTTLSSPEISPSPEETAITNAPNIEVDPEEPAKIPDTQLNPQSLELPVQKTPETEPEFLVNETISPVVEPESTPIYPKTTPKSLSQEGIPSPREEQPIRLEEETSTELETSSNKKPQWLENTLNSLKQVIDFEKLFQAINN